MKIGTLVVPDAAVVAVAGLVAWLILKPKNKFKVGDRVSLRKAALPKPVGSILVVNEPDTLRKPGAPVGSPYIQEWSYVVSWSNGPTFQLETELEAGAVAGAFDVLPRAQSSAPAAPAVGTAVRVTGNAYAGMVGRIEGRKSNGNYVIRFPAFPLPQDIEAKRVSMAQGAALMGRMRR